jgi:hypothetical protein
MLQKETIESNNLHNNNNAEFSFGNSRHLINNYNKKIHNKMITENESKNINCLVNDIKYNNMKKKNTNIIYNLLNRNKNTDKGKIMSFFSNINNINQTNNITKPKLDINKNNYNSPKKNYQKLNYYNNSNNKEENNIGNILKEESLFIVKENKKKDEEIKEIMEIFDLKEDDKLPYEIKYFLSNPKFNYDFEHQNDGNSNYQYINENFIDILLNSFNTKMILNVNIKSIRDIQKEITFSKRNILISWLTEINFKYIKDQNILFTAIKYLDLILYSKNINIDEFQLVGILCFNLALKMENHHKVFSIDEIISLIGGGGDNVNEKCELSKKIKKKEHIICDFLNFELEISTSILILRRLIQMLNIQNKKTEEIFCTISYFFLEISLYDEQFYELDEFVKALSSLIIAKELLRKYLYRIGFHDYLTNCSKLKKKEIKYYYTLCVKVIKNLKMYKYGSAIFFKYDHKDFYHVISNYLNQFIIECTQDKIIIV